MVKKPDPTRFAFELFNLLHSSQSPFLDKAYTSSSDGKNVVQLLADAEYMNDAKIWSCLNKIPLARPGLASHQTLLASGKAEEALLQDFDICLEVPLDLSQPVCISPYTIEKVTIPHDALVATAAISSPFIGFHWWPFSPKDKDKKAEGENKREEMVVEKKVFYPSKDKVSVQASWWGYSIYLPPPVLEKLKPGAEGVVDVLASLALALTTIIAVAPTLAAGLPAVAALVPVATITGLSPIVGYVAAFVKWSWGKIVGKDKGKGIVLSASWILPIALIPRAWDALDKPVDAIPAQELPTHPVVAPIVATQAKNEELAIAPTEAKGEDSKEDIAPVEAINEIKATEPPPQQTDGNRE